MLRRTVARWACAAMVLAGVVPLARATPPPLRVVGSDLLGLEFSQACYRFAGRAGLAVTLALDGSRSGLDALRAQRADLAILTVPPATAAELGAFWRVPLGHHRVVVLAAADCPLEAVTLPQLAAIFAPAAAGAPVTWGDLGVKEAWATERVVALAPETGRGLALEWFRQVATEGRPIAAEVARYADLPELRARFAGTGVRLLALAPGPVPGAKVLAVARGPGAAAALPESAALASGDYPLGLPVELVFRAERTAALEPLLAWLRGEEAAALLAPVHVWPVAAVKTDGRK